MKQKFLFFILACFIVLTKPLSAQDINDNSKKLIETICQFLSNGYTPGDIVTILNNGHDQEAQIQKLVASIKSSLDSHHSKDEILNAVFNNKEFESFFSLKNLKTKMQMAYYALTAVAIITLVIIVCYILYRILSFFTGFGFPLPFGWRDHNDQNGSQQQNNQPPQGQPQRNATEHNQLNTNQTQDADQPHQTIMVQAARATQQPVQPQSDAQPGNITALGVNKFMAWYDRTLDATVVQQTQQAKNLGLNPAMLQQTAFDAIENLPPQEPRGNRKFKDLIDQQIAYAQSIGLVPATLPVSAHDPLT